MKMFILEPESRLRSFVYDNNYLKWNRAKMVLLRAKVNERLGDSAGKAIRFLCTHLQGYNLHQDSGNPHA